MKSDSPMPPLYCVAVRYGADVLEHVGDTESSDFRAALFLAGRVREWLSQGTGFDLPDAALDLRGELEAAGHDPRRARVSVVRLPARGAGLWDTRPDHEWVVPDAPRAACDEDDCDDTPLMPALPRVRVLHTEGR